MPEPSKGEPAVQVGSEHPADNGLKPTSLLKSENVRSILAYVIVVGLLAFIVAMTAWKGIDVGERVAAISTGILGAVVGFYFGRQGFDRALRRADAAERASVASLQVKTMADGTASELEDALEDAAREYDALFAAYKALAGRQREAQKIKKNPRHRRG